MKTLLMIHFDKANHNFPFIFPMLPWSHVKAKGGKKVEGQCEDMVCKSSCLVWEGKRESFIYCFSPAFSMFKPKTTTFKLLSRIIPILLYLQPRRFTNKRHEFLCECSYGPSLLNVSWWAEEALHHQQPFISSCRTAHISDLSSNNATSNRPTTQFSSRAESTSWLQD